MKNFLVIGTMILLAAGQALAGRNCLSQHLAEAIELNKERREIYSQMTDGKSKKVSNQLIRYEQFIYGVLPMTGIENAAEKLQTEGIPFLCDDFHATANPNSPTLQTKNPDLKTFQSLDHKKAKKLLDAQIESKNLNGVYDQAVLLIDSIKGEMRFNCMVRHVLESIARVAKQGLIYDQMASEKNLSIKPSELTLKVLKYETKALWGSVQLDQKAAPFQAAGVPILCHDLPVVHF